MSTPSSERMLKLMAYADGELTGAELEEVEGWLEEDNRAVRLANEMANLGDLVKTGFLASPTGKGIASFDIADAIMAKVAAEPTQVKAQTSEKKGALPPVVHLDAERLRRQKNVKLGAGALAALALAASVLMMTRSKEEQPMARAPVQVAPAPAPNGSTGPGVDVDLVETPGHSVSVFYLPSESTLTTSVVVWVDETGDKK